MLAHAGWQPAPLVLIGAALALLFFGRAFVRLRSRGRTDLAPWWRALAFVGGVSLGVLAVVSPLDGIGEEQLLSAHMLQHVILGDLVPVLLIVALQGPLLWMATPRPLLRAIHRTPRLRAFVAFLTRPAVAFAVWAGALAVWHVPVLYEAALEQPVLHDLQHASFFLGGLLVWAQLVDPARRRALSPLARIGFAVFLLAAGGALVNVLVFSEPLYASYLGPRERVIDLAPSVDQQAAGMVMLLEQWLTVGAFVAFMLVRRPGSVVGVPGPVAAGEHPISF
jgi:putative membrane protein